MSSVINLQDVSIDAVRGTADAGAAINAAIAALDDTRNLAKSGAARQGWDSSGTGAVYIPSQWEGKQVELDVQTVITRTARQNVIIYSDGPWGPRLINNTGQNYMVDVTDVSATGNVFRLKGLAFDGGSVRLTGSMRGDIGVFDCIFQSTPVPAVHLVDESVTGLPTDTSTAVVGFRAERNYFVECNGGIWAESGTHTLSRIVDNRFLWSDGTPLVINGPGYKILRNDFQLMEATAGNGVNGAFIWFKGGYDQLDPAQHTISLSTVDGNRFGSESGSTYNGKTYYPPYQAVLVGEPGVPKALTDGATNISGTATINFDDNEFLGVSANLHATTPAGHAEYGIVFWNRPIDCVIGPRLTARNYRTALVGDPFRDSAAPYGTYGPQRDRNFFNVSLSDQYISHPDAAHIGPYGPGTTALFEATSQREWRRPFVNAGGIRTASPDGSQWYVTVNNAGNITAPTDVT